jgi:hypothetical protein
LEREDRLERGKMLLRKESITVPDTAGMWWLVVKRGQGYVTNPGNHTVNRLYGSHHFRDASRDLAAIAAAQLSHG